jgi:hypothetical protein
MEMNLNRFINHPIWSNVIAGVILMGIASSISEIKQLNWEHIHSALLETPIAFFLIFLSIILFCWALYKVFKRLIFWTKRKTQNEIHKDTSNLNYFSSEGKTTDFFSGRISDAFPGIRGFQWINDSRTAIDRLEILLRNPLKFKLQSYEDDKATITPIWWFSRGSSSEITSFRVLRYPMFFGLIKGKVVIGWNEYIIKRIGVYHSSGRYYQDMVYVETIPDKPTGLYSKNENYIRRSREEYALFKGRKITREEYDDGSAIINGKPVICYGSELRVRNLARFNFIICAKFAPYNSREFDNLSMDEFDEILEGKKKFEDIFERMKTLPRIDKHMQY